MRAIFAAFSAGYKGALTQNTIASAEERKADSHRPMKETRDAQQGYRLNRQADTGFGDWNEQGHQLAVGDYSRARVCREALYPAEKNLCAGQTKVFLR
jgi:hypothetical protein